MPKSILNILHTACLLVLCWVLLSASAWGQQAQLPPAPPPDQTATPAPASSAGHAQQPGAAQNDNPANPAAPAAQYDKSIFVSPVPTDLLTGLKPFTGQPTKVLMHDKQFRKLLHALLPKCEFHYGRDMPLDDAVDMVLKDSRIPVQLVNGRYLLLSGKEGPYLSGRAFLWFDLQDGLFLGGFSFQPTNGEPTPTLAIFSSQVKQEPLSLGLLPPEFAEEMTQWESRMGVPLQATRYFLTGNKRRVLLEHDEEYCSIGNAWSASPQVCQEMDAHAADTDETAAYYLNQVHYATNATAWMVGPDQVAWLQVRTNACGGLLDPLGCRIRVTRLHTHVLMRTGRR